MNRAIPRLRPATFAGGGAGIFDGRRTDARILGTGEQGRQSKTAAPAEPAAAVIIATLAPTLRAQTARDGEGYSQLL